MTPVPDTTAAAVLSGGGELGERMRAIDWSATPLGPVDRWPQSLRTCVRIMLSSQPPMRSLPSTADADRHATILVADDDADMREYLVRLLSARWAVRSVPDGAQALAAARAQRPDLILTDVAMPNLDGFGLVRAIRADPGLATVPVIALSVWAGEDSRIEGIAAGADDYLTKPCSSRELIARVTNTLQLARLRRDVELERNRLAAFIEQTPVGVVLWEGPELRCALVNDAFRRIARRPVEVGARLAELFPELAGTDVERRLAHVQREGVPLDVSEVEVHTFEADGSPRVGYFTISYRPIQDGHGRRDVLAVGYEVTEQVLARRAVESSRADLVVANRAKDEFLAMLGHELRNPLAPIQTACELMRLRAADVVERERTIIERQTAHLTALVEDLLDVSRITRGVVHLRRERVRLGEAIAKAVETVAPLFEQQGHDLVTDVPHDLELCGDPARLTQVFANLLTNAAKYTDPGGRVAITAARDGDELDVAVSDNGRGIAADMLPRVFELFVQERQNLDRARGGLGLGLAIVKNLVELHGGRVEVESGGPGQGSTFRVHLPALVAEAVPLATGAVPTPRPMPANTTPTVLVVDDNEDAAELMVELLESLGYRTRIAHDAPEVLEAACEFVPDIALVDIGLPTIDGYELARRLRALPSWRGVKMLALTGYGQDSDRERSRAAGFDQHLVKPIGLSTIERYLPPLSAA
jgi:signal transduction histidine kinase